MLRNFIPLVDWTLGVIGIAVMGVVFLVLIVVMIVFMRSGKKKN